jgi:hypothetical protein
MGSNYWRNANLTPHLERSDNLLAREQRCWHGIAISKRGAQLARQKAAPIVRPRTV